MLGRISLAAALAVAVGTGAAASSSHATTRAAPCGPSCRAAYGAIARALPQDRENVLLSALLHTRGIDWTMLAVALHVPTARQIHARWMHECERRFPGDPGSTEACYLLIFGP